MKMDKRKFKILILFAICSFALISNGIQAQTLTLQGDTLSIVLLNSYLNFYGNGFAPDDSFAVSVETTKTDSILKQITTITDGKGFFSGSFLIDSSTFVPKVYFCRVRPLATSILNWNIAPSDSVLATATFSVGDPHLDEIVGDVIINENSESTTTNKVKLTLAGNYRGDPLGEVVVSNCICLLSSGYDPPTGGQSFSMCGSSEIHINWALNLSALPSSVSVYAKFYYRDADPSWSIYKTDDILYCVSPITVNAKVFLQGPYNPTSMQNELRTNNYIPLEQPYGECPWLYNGNECVTQVPANVVDWILVELRTDTAASTTVEIRAGFIKTDGTIVDLDGSSFLSFDSPPADYYIVLCHRNHLAVMSKSKITLCRSTPASWDFTTGMDQAYGSNPMVELESGVFGMYAGDADANGQVQNNDKNIFFWGSQTGQSGYLSADFNLNGEVQNNDKNIFCRPNLGHGSQVP
jgi:hypothetical protein